MRALLILFHSILPQLAPMTGIDNGHPQVAIASKLWPSCSALAHSSSVLHAFLSEHEPGGSEAVSTAGHYARSLPVSSFCRCCCLVLNTCCRHASLGFVQQPMRCLVTGQPLQNLCRRFF